MIQSARSARKGIGLTALSCLVLAACNGASDPGGASLEQSVPSLTSNMQALATPHASAKQAPGASIASLPAEAGAVASVRAHAYADGFRQDILLKGSAMHGVENGIAVVARTSLQPTLDEAAPLFKPTEPAIRSELGRTFPRMSMQIVERPSSNAYGSYGLALGRAAGSIHCIYAWQWIDRSDLGKDAGLTGPVTIRIRLCKADASFDALADLVNHLSIRRDAPGLVAEAVIEPPDQTSTPTRRSRSSARRAHHPPVDSSRRLGSVISPPVVAAAPAVVQPLATDLPPQAYLGPKSQPSSIKQN